MDPLDGLDTLCLSGGQTWVCQSKGVGPV